MGTKFWNLRRARKLLRDLRMKLDMRPHPYRLRMPRDSGSFALQFTVYFPTALRGVFTVRLVAKKGDQKESDHCLVVCRWVQENSSEFSGEVIE